MYRRVLVGTDGSAAADRAVDRAAWLAQLDGATLHAATVVHGAMAEVRGRSTGDADDPYGRAKLVLDDVVARLPGLDVVTDTVDGQPSEGLRELADRLAIDLVVVGNAGLDSPARLVLGTVATELLTGPPCDVLVVRTRDGRRAVSGIEPYATILAGVAPTERGGRALDRAVALAHRTGGRLVITHAAPSREEAQAVLEPLADALNHLEQPVGVRPLTGDPAAAVGTLAEEIGADVTVVGDLGLAGSWRARRDAVASRLAPVVPGDLLVVHTGD